MTPRALFILSLCTALGCAAEPLELNVRAFGAKGDGSTDDTLAFHTAIAEGAKLKLPVRVPQGSYVITQPLTLKAQRLTGEPNASFGADVMVLPTMEVQP
jgi:Pectate lyase superfamily protein